ncbi:hypothetical protein LXL04_007032 [Taraxacum kok-saghyz]
MENEGKIEKQKPEIATSTKKNPKEMKSLPLKRASMAGNRRRRMGEGRRRLLTWVAVDVRRCNRRKSEGRSSRRVAVEGRLGSREGDGRREVAMLKFLKRIPPAPFYGSTLPFATPPSTLAGRCSHLLVGHGPGTEKTKEMVGKVTKTPDDLFSHYKGKAENKNVPNPQDTIFGEKSSVSEIDIDLELEFDKFDDGGQDIKTRHVLAMPISTVASESAFSVGGRVIDRYRSSLNPETAEALICAQDWIRRTRIDLELGSSMKNKKIDEFNEKFVGIKIGKVFYFSPYLRFYAKNAPNRTMLTPIERYKNTMVVSSIIKTKHIVGKTKRILWLGRQVRINKIR